MAGADSDPAADNVERVPTSLVELLARKRVGVVLESAPKRRCLLLEDGSGEANGDGGCERRSLVLKGGNEGTCGDGDDSVCSVYFDLEGMKYKSSISSINLLSDVSMQYVLMILKQYLAMSPLSNDNNLMISYDQHSNVEKVNENSDLEVKLDITGREIVSRYLQNLSGSLKLSHCFSDITIKWNGNVPEVRPAGHAIRPIGKICSEGVNLLAVTSQVSEEVRHPINNSELILGDSLAVKRTLFPEAHELEVKEEAHIWVDPHASGSKTIDDVLSPGQAAPIPAFRNSTAKELLDQPKSVTAVASLMQTQASSIALNDEDNSISDRKQQSKGHVVYVRKKTRKERDQDKIIVSSTLRPENNPVETKKLPQFELFVVEEEEGSGGYGTVYRARRTIDGKTFAIKCPHSGAQSYHVNNELKMLEQFGGRSFIIKLEGSFKYGQSDCFVLEHVKHDRPEVLKKEINISELRWYGYCMFKALSSLHKQGIVHRDVKPGNFLFSRELSKGYLIDFNLATDLHHKQRAYSKSDAKAKAGSVHSLHHGKPSSSSHSRNAMNSKQLEVSNKNKGETSKKQHLLPKNTSKRAGKGLEGVVSKFDGRNKSCGQAADASGVTSVKDATSTRTLSVERLREPIPCHGRKELINLVQEAMQSPNQKTELAPTSQRKRIAAPLGKVERLLASLTPMPLYSNGVAIPSPRTLKSKGDKNHKTEGPCVGTKGFRAPEVLFKSLHQGCKADLWSSGVTLLYFIIGRSPFTGDPEQNIKEIAKLRGSEDLWEVAKLHNREPSFPLDLFDVQSLRFMDLKSWCRKNTKKPEFFEKIPNDLFDLVDKCLTVNPRLRISADEALMHDFFAPCRATLRKHRMLRLSSGLESENQPH